MAYLDDLLIVAPTKEDCQRAMEICIKLLRELGFAIAWDKVVVPTTCLTFLGIEINTVPKCLCLPAQKV